MKKKVAKSKLGRPPLAASKRRGCAVMVRFTRENHKIFKRIARDRGETVAVAVHDAALGGLGG